MYLNTLDYYLFILFQAFRTKAGLLKKNYMLLVGIYLVIKSQKEGDIHTKNSKEHNFLKLKWYFIHTMVGYYC